MYKTEIDTVWKSIDMKSIKNKIYTIVKKYKPEKIILFGSYATGNPTPDSDVDLLIIINTKQPTWDVSIDISLLLKHSFPMDIIVKTPQEIQKRLNYGDYFIKDIIEKGKVIYERTC